MTRPGLAFLLTAMLAAAGPVRAQEAPPDSTAVEDDSWITRSLERYFGAGDQQAEDLEGESLEVVDAYWKHAGKPIEVVIVHQVASFREGWDQDKPATDRVLNSLTGSFQSYTRDGIIRDYLLFEQGDKVDPFALADSEVMLRNLPYINDVRLVLIPLLGEVESVAVVVETTDRWPFGVKGKVVTAEKYSVDVYSENVAGTGTKFSNEFLHQSSGDPSWGYRGRLLKENLNGSFLAAELTYENSYRRRSAKLSSERKLSHPGLHAVGGVSVEHTEVREAPTLPLKYDEFDIWMGEVKRLYDPRDTRVKRRPLLVPAVRFNQRRNLVRPTVAPDTNRGFHNRSLFLAGVTFQRLRDFKTSYLFGDGETEDLPVGQVLKLTSGYEAREFENRTPFFLEGGLISSRHRGDVVFLKSEFGGYFRNRKLEDGQFFTRGGYITTLKGEPGFQYRFFTELSYTLGIGRHPLDRIYLGERVEIRDLPRRRIAGNQRLAGSLETRVFTHLALWGFRFSFFGYVDAGMVGGEDASSIFKEKVYVSSGLGIRLRNPSLVLPTVQLQVGFLTNVDEPGVAFSIDVGNAPGQEIGLPGTKPSVPSYQ